MLYQWNDSSTLGQKVSISYGANTVISVHKRQSPHPHRAGAGRGLSTVGDSILNVWSLRRPKGYYLFPPGFHPFQTLGEESSMYPSNYILSLFVGARNHYLPLFLGEGRKKNPGCSSKVKVHTLKRQNS